MWTLYHFSNIFILDRSIFFAKTIHLLQQWLHLVSGWEKVTLIKFIFEGDMRIAKKGTYFVETNRKQARSKFSFLNTPCTWQGSQEKR